MVMVRTVVAAGECSEARLTISCVFVGVFACVAAAALLLLLLLLLLLRAAASTPQRPDWSCAAVRELVQGGVF